MTENDHLLQGLQVSNVDEILNKEIFEETTEEILTNVDVQMPIMNEIVEDLSSSGKEELISQILYDTLNKNIELIRDVFNDVFHAKQDEDDIYVKQKNKFMKTSYYKTFEAAIA